MTNKSKIMNKQPSGEGTKMNERKLPPPRNATKPPKPRPIPEDDGVAFINIYIKGVTELGRKASHFTHMPFVHPVYGPFQNMEGYWHYIKSEERPDELRYMTGHQAKMFAASLKQREVDNFQELIFEGNYCKAIQNPEYKDLLMNFKPELPFEHFYMWGEDQSNASPIRPRTFEWLTASFERLREMLIAGGIPDGLIGRNLHN